MLAGDVLWKLVGKMIGEPQDYSGEGNSRADITLTGVQSMLAMELTAVNTNVVAVTFSGRPKSIEKEEEFLPYTSNYIDCGNLALYSFGHGLSYSNFIYESMELSSDKITMDAPVTAKITVKNDSDVIGKETVMLYMRDMYASNSRPVQQMIAFEKVEIGARETKIIEFTIDETMLRFWNNHHKFVSEPGLFKISTGYADHLIHTTDLILE